MKAWLVAIANALFPGIGYVILQKRIIFGWLLLPGSALAWYIAFTIPAPETSAATAFVFLVSSVLSSLAFGYDAYTAAKE